jgi:hypothetical protein
MRCCDRKPHAPNPPANPVHEIAYNVLNPRQKGLFLTYPGVTPADASDFWMGSLSLSQRVEFAGAIQAIQQTEKAHGWQALETVTKIHGSDPSAPSEQQFNNEVIWNQDTPSHFEKLPCWSEHIALLHPGQFGYQENRDGDPFLGLVVLFDEDPANPTRPSGQFHIGFRSFFGHYEAVNGDIGNSDNYKLYERWYGYIDSFLPAQ